MMMKIKNELPEKGKDIIGYTPDGEKHYIFRCNCYNPNCTEWRCSITGFGMILKIVEWEYEKEYERKLKIKKIIENGKYYKRRNDKNIKR